MKQLAVLGLASIVAMTTASVASAQEPGEAGARMQATRPQLERMLERYEQGARAEGYSDEVRQIARDEADLIRRRLEEGDVQVGDQIQLTVTGMPALSTTFTVSEGRVLQLPDVGAVPLDGMLRSELQQGIRDHLAGFIVEPQVFVRSLIRVSVRGAVGTPGYLVVPSDVLVTDVLAQAGQPTATARIDDMRITRGDDVIWDGEALQTAIVEGRTIDQLNLRAGDRIEVPDGATTGRSVLSRVASSLVYVVPTIMAIVGLVTR